MAELYEVSDSPKDPAIHVVFLHGLGGHHKKTWTYGKGDDGFWPRWLVEKFPDIGVWTVGYSSSMTNWNGKSLAWTDAAENVLRCINLERRLAIGNLVFIGHSNGGIVITQLLRAADRDSRKSDRRMREQAESILSRTRGVIFLGVPHAGSWLPILAGSILGKLLLFRSSPTTSALESEDPNLRELKNWYKIFSENASINHCVLFETAPLSFCGLNLPRFTQVVAISSADPGIAGVTPIPIEANHSQICKPESRSSQIFREVCAFLENPDLRKLNLKADESENLIVGRLDSIDQKISVVLPKNPVGSVYINDAALRELNTIRRHRFFQQYPTIELTLELIDKINGGSLVGMSAAEKSYVLAWCSRIISRKNIVLATEILSFAKLEQQNQFTKVAECCISWYANNDTSAIGTLTSMNSPLCTTAAFLLIHNSDGPEKALKWLEDCGYSLDDMDSDGKLIIAQIYQSLDLEKSISIIESFSTTDFEETPALYQLSADTYLKSSVNPELRESVIFQPSLDAANFPLSDLAHHVGYRRKAIDFYKKMEDVLLGINLIDESNFSKEKVLWLRLRDHELHNEAKKELEEEMSNGSSALRFINLAMQYQIPIDRDAVTREINKEIARCGGKSAIAERANFTLVVYDNDPRTVMEYIDTNLTRLKELFDESWLTNIYIQLLVHTGDTQTAQSIVNSLDSENQSNVSRLQMFINQKLGMDTSLQMIEAFESSKSLIDLVKLIEVLLNKNNVSLLTKYLPILFELTGRLEDAETYAQHLYNHGPHTQLLDFLNTHNNLISQSERLKYIKCCLDYSQGNFVEAQRDLRELKSKGDLYIYRDLETKIAIASGDWAKLQAQVENEWENIRNRPTNELLLAARLAATIDSPRTKEFLKFIAASYPNDPNILINCYSIAVSVGLDDEEGISNWLNTAAKLSGSEGPVKSVSLDTLIAEMPKWHEKTRGVIEQWERGEIPGLAVATGLNRSLIDLTVTTALNNMNESDIRKRSIILACSGRREELAIDVNKLVLDPMSLLTAEMLGLVDLLIENFQITIPLTTMGWLFEESRKIAYHQPKLIKNAHLLQRSFADGTIQIFQRVGEVPFQLIKEVGEDVAAILTEISERSKDINESQHILIHHYPIHRVESLMAAEADISNYQEMICSCYGVVKKLLQKTKLTAMEAEKCKSYLELVGERQWDNEPSITDGSVLYIDITSLQRLQHLKLLNKMRDAGLTILVTKHTQLDNNALLSYESQANNTLGIIENLRVRLKDAIFEKRISIANIKSSDTQDEIRFHPTIASFELMAEYDAVVVQDRNLNQNARYIHADGSRLVLSLIDVIRILRARNVIGNVEEAEYKTKLRQYGYALIPLDFWELDFHLSAAQVTDGKLVETTPLKAIRENILHLKSTDVLQLPTEIAWLNGMLISCCKALKRVWNTDIDVNTSIAKSNWLLNMIDIRKWAHRYEHITPNVDARYRGLVLALTITPTEVPESIQAAYWLWLENVVLRPLKEENHNLYQELLALAEETFVNSLEFDDE